MSANKQSKHESTVKLYRKAVKANQRTHKPKRNGQTNQKDEFVLKIDVPAFDYSKQQNPIDLPVQSADGATCEPASRQNELMDAEETKSRTKHNKGSSKSIMAAACVNDVDALQEKYQAERTEAGDDATKLDILQKQAECAMVQAILGKNVAIVERLLNLGVEMSDLARYYAIISDSTELIDMVISKKISFVMAGEGTTALHHLARIGNISLMRKILQLNQIDVSVIGANHGETALHVAIQYNNSFCAHLLMDAGADINIQDSKGKAPIHEAAIRGNDALVKRLVDDGADPCVLDNDHKSPWIYALHYRQVKTAKKIMKYMKPDNLKTILPNGQSYLHLAAGLGDINTTNTLLEQGCDLSMTDNDGNTPLMCAISTVLPNEKFIKFLLEQESVKDSINIHNGSDESALSLVFKKSKLFVLEVEIAKTLVQHGANVDDIFSDDMTLAMRYVMDKDKLKALIELGADLNITGPTGINVVWAAWKWGSKLELLQNLLENNVDIRLGDKSGPDYDTTVFIESLKDKDVECAKFLYNSGCSLNGVKAWLKTDEGKDILNSSSEIQQLVSQLEASGKLCTAPSLWEQARLATLGTMGCKPLGDKIDQLGLPCMVACLLDHKNYQKFQRHQLSC